jgi:hypothetical protein
MNARLDPIDARLDGWRRVNRIETEMAVLKRMIGANIDIKIGCSGSS